MNDWRRKQIPVVSTALVIINAAVYVICLFTGNTLYRAGALGAYEVLVDGEYGRIIWSMFLHSGTNHILNNMLILFFLGAMIEKETGHILYALLYFLSGIGGNILSLYIKAINGDMSISVGASGAVFGLDGVLLAMVWVSDKRLENVTPVRVIMMVVLSLYNGFTAYNIDNAAHVGGLITGFLAGGLVCIIQRRSRGGGGRNSFA